MELTVTVNFVHIFLGNTNDLALLNDLGVFPDDGLHVLKVFHGDLQLLAKPAASSSNMDHVAYQRLYAF